MTLPELHLRAAYIASSDNHSWQLSESAVARCRVAGLITRYLYPLVAVIHRCRFVFFKAETNMMHHRRIARQDLHRRDPSIGLERSRERDQLPLQNSLCRNFVRRKVHDNFRLYTPAACGPCDRGRSIFWIALRGSGVCPFHQHINLALFQGTVVGKMTILRVCEPWRHSPRDNRSLDRLCPW